MIYGVHLEHHEPQLGQLAHAFGKAATETVVVKRQVSEAGHATNSAGYRASDLVVSDLEKDHLMKRPQHPTGNGAREAVVRGREVLQLGELIKCRWQRTLKEIFAKCQAL